MTEMEGVHLLLNNVRYSGLGKTVVTTTKPRVSEVTWQLPNQKTIGKLCLSKWLVVAGARSGPTELLEQWKLQS